jgi:hypothetical protein
MLRKEQYSVTLSDRSSVQPLTDKHLGNTGQLWLFFSDPSGNRQLTVNEAKLVSSFNERGGGMLVAVGNRQGDVPVEASVNTLASRYGIQFFGSAENEPRITVGMMSQLFSPASELLGRFLKIVHKA